MNRIVSPFYKISFLNIPFSIRPEITLEWIVVFDWVLIVVTAPFPDMFWSKAETILQNNDRIIVINLFKIL
jgi:hypothetical protein